MPFYEYECSSCRYYAEVMQKITDQPLKKCLSCGKSTFKKLISAPVFRLKGSGWYETDFKSDKDNKRNLAGSDKDESSGKSESKTETAAAAAPDSKSDAKADTKADTKAEAKPGTKSEGKGAAKGDTAASAPAPKPPAPTTRNVGARSGSGKGSATAKSAPARRASPPKRKATKRRGGR